MLTVQRYTYISKAIMKYARGWLAPYILSRLRSPGFRPIVAHLFTDGRCNVYCHYCYTRYNKRGMTHQTAARAIDFLKSFGCRAFGFMGGEPLIRKDFVLDVVRYGARNGFFVDLATNGIPMTEEYIHQLGTAGIGSVNLAVDCIDERPGLPKSLNRLGPVFQHLVEQRHKYGYLVFLNVNVTSRNLEDVRDLTEIAYENDLGIDYHIAELPIVDEEREAYKHREFLLTEEYWEELDTLVDWLIEKDTEGYTILNSKAHLSAMKDFARGKMEPWDCRAGRNAIAVHEDGSLSPCMGLYASKQDWGSIFNYKYDPEQLDAQLKKCNTRCSSALHYQLSEAYNHVLTNDSWRVWNWR